MSRIWHRRFLPAAAIAVVASLLPLACTSHTPPAGPTATPAPPATPATPVPPGQAVPQVRVNQVGYPAGAPKVAFAMLTRPAAEVSFTVTGRQGVVFRGRTARSLGGWNSHYPAVYVLGFSGLTRPGSYRIRVSAAGATAVSPAFAIGSPAGLYHRLVLNAVRYFTSERDGADVVASVFNRQPANLTDQHAYVYASPRFDSNDNLLGKLRRVGGPVNVAGGWFDAGGGYEKFAYTSSYADGLMLLAARDFPGTYPGLAPEGRLRAQLAGKALEPGSQGGVHPGRNRYRQREQHDPGRLQLLVPAAGRRPHRRQPGRPSRPHRLLRQIPAGLRGGPAGSADQPQTSPAGSRPTTPSAPSWRRSRTRLAPSTCWRWPAASTPWPRPATSARS